MILKLLRGSFWKKDNLLQYTMTLLQGPKDTVLPTLSNLHTYFCFSWLSIYLTLSNVKVHIFGAGHKILRNLNRSFDRYYFYGGDFAKFCGLLRIYELYHPRPKLLYQFFNYKLSCLPTSAWRQWWSFEIKIQFQTNVFVILISLIFKKVVKNLLPFDLETPQLTAC